MVSCITRRSMLLGQMGGLQGEGFCFLCFSFFLNEFFTAVPGSLYFGWRLRQQKQSVTY